MMRGSERIEETWLVWVHNTLLRLVAGNFFSETFFSGI